MGYQRLDVGGRGARWIMIRSIGVLDFLCIFVDGWGIEWRIGLFDVIRERSDKVAFFVRFKIVSADVCEGISLSPSRTAALD